MKIVKSASAGSFESSDIMILIEPGEENSGIIIEIDSPVKKQYGEQIEKIIFSKLKEFKIKDIKLIAKDKGALDPTISARVETALQRAANLQKGTLV